MTTVKTQQILNIVAIKEGEAMVHLQIADDMDMTTVMEALATWLDWGYSLKADM